MHVQQAASTTDATELRSFAEYLLRIGNGVEPAVSMGEGLIPDRVRIPERMLMRRYNTYDLIAAIYGNLSTTNLTTELLISHAILTPKNKDVATLNDKVLELFPGEAHEFKSADAIDNPEDQIAYPLELLNSLNPSDLPPHSLKLKVGCPVMLLRNLDTAQGLCNGTRLICRSFQQYVLEADIATGPFAGTTVLIPRISLTPNENRSPIMFKRTQFPVRLAFSMTINKAQGQTFDSVGLYLPEPPFTHGLLYVAMSRVRTPSAIHIMVDPENSQIEGRTGNYTRNVVFREVLL